MHPEGPTESPVESPATSPSLPAASPSFAVETVDYHTAGEPFRIVQNIELMGDTVPERRAFARQSSHTEMIRQLLVNEPRGHADMYGCFIVPANDPGAHFGAVFWHKDGYSTACGHGTIALAVWAVDSGLVSAVCDGQTQIVVDVPSGRVRADVSCAGGHVQNVVFSNVDSYVIARGVEVDTRRGPVSVDVSYAGAVYASLPAQSVGLSVTPENYNELIGIGRHIKHALNNSVDAVTQAANDPHGDGVYGTIVFDDLGQTHQGPWQRNITVFADGEVDRSPCGSGTSARIVLLIEDDRINTEQYLTHDSIVDTRFLAWWSHANTHGYQTHVQGTAFRTAESTFVLDRSDPVGTGFVLR